MITDEASLEESLKVLNASVESAIHHFESSVGLGALVSLQHVTMSRNEIVPNSPIKVVSSSAKIITNDINLIVST